MNAQPTNGGGGGGGPPSVSETPTSVVATNGTNPSLNQYQSIDIEDLIELAGVKPPPPAAGPAGQGVSLRPILANNNNNNNTTKPNGTLAVMKKTPTFKDSIDDIDDMLTDFENKYTSSKPAAANKIPMASMGTKPAANNSLPPPKRGSIVPGGGGGLANANNRHTSGSRPSQQSIRDSILAQFKDDPIFSDLLHTTTTTTTAANNTTTTSTSSATKPVPTQQGQQMNRLANNESPSGKQHQQQQQLNSGRRPSNMMANNQYINNLQRRNSIYDHQANNNNNNAQNPNNKVNKNMI